MSLNVAMCCVQTKQAGKLATLKQCRHTLRQITSILNGDSRKPRATPSPEYAENIPKRDSGRVFHVEIRTRLFGHRHDRHLSIHIDTENRSSLQSRPAIPTTVDMFKASTKHNIQAGPSHGEVKQHGKGKSKDETKPYPYRLNL